MTDSAQLLDVARTAAARAHELIRKYYDDGEYSVTRKSDRSPVTEADIAAEKAIRSCIAEAFPEHGFYGEETGSARRDSQYLWLVDPIDGTKGFVRRYPFFSTQIAVMVDGELTVGVSNAPEFEELAWASAGAGAVLNNEALRVSTVDRLEDASVSCGNIQTLARGDRWPALGSLLGRVDRTRGYGDFYHYHLLAQGKIELVIESDVNILDIAALTVIVRAAGGVMTDLQGGPISLDTTSVLAGNAQLHAQALEILNHA